MGVRGRAEPPFRSLVIESIISRSRFTSLLQFSKTEPTSGGILKWQTLQSSHSMFYSLQAFSMLHSQYVAQSVCRIVSMSHSMLQVTGYAALSQ